MTLKVTVTITDGKWSKVYELTQTQEATKNEKTGNFTTAIFQPASENTILKPFSKNYIDTVELGKAIKAEAKEVKAGK